MKEALLYRKLEQKKVQCLVCSHYCLIQPDRNGVCAVRTNRDGKLYALNYGRIISKAVDPIEKKPFFHFLPGSLSYSVATIGCNFRCDNCQNWQISQLPKGRHQLPKFPGEDLSPLDLVNEAKKNDCESIAYTYTEPTIFLEFAHEAMILAKKVGLKNVWVSNGYMSKETRQLIAPHLDAINIDLKFFDNEHYLKVCGGHLEPILDNLKWFVKNKVWVEITTLAIPTLSDQEAMFKKIAQFIFNELGPETPWHISRFSSEISFRLQKLYSTPVEVIHRAWKIGQAAGLKYVYGGNLFGDESENTYCPECHELVIERIGYNIKRYDNNSQCQNCHYHLKIIN